MAKVQTAGDVDVVSRKVDTRSVLMADVFVVTEAEKVR
jgi:hypothetical protein